MSPLAVLLSLLVGLAWLLATENGFRVACRALEELAELAGGQLTLAEPSGSLHGSLSLPSLHWRDATLDVQLQDLQFDWRPAELLRTRLSVSRLAVARLRVASLPSDEPSVMPDSLRLPLGVDIDELRLGRLELGEYAHPDGQATTVVEELALRLSSDGAVHRLSGLRATASGLALSGELSLAGDQPYVLTASARIEGEAAGRALAFDLLAEGSLEELSLRGSGQPLDGSAIIATSYPDAVKRALAGGDAAEIEAALADWQPLVDIPFDLAQVEHTIDAFGRAVDDIETGQFAPPPPSRLAEVIERGETFATRVCIECDARYSCASYRRYAADGRGPTTDFFRLYADERDREFSIELRLGAEARVEVE